jgi:hypothetical protein
MFQYMPDGHVRSSRSMQSALDDVWLVHSNVKLTLTDSPVPPSANCKPVTLRAHAAHRVSHCRY